MKKKIKKQTTIYITDEEEDMVNRLLFFRAKLKQKTTRSALFCEGLRYMYKNEVGDVF